MLKDLFIILLIFSYSLLQGQSLSMKLKLKNSPKRYPITIQTNPKNIYQLKEAGYSIEIGSQAGDMMTLYCDEATIQAIYKQPFHKKITDGGQQMVALLDSSKIFNNFDSVYYGYSPLIQSYKGKNVVMGIIDFGIDWRHSDFKNADSTTRIYRLWDQNVNTTAPSGYSYGTEWTDIAINQGLCTHFGSSNYGHGTSVAGIAAGNGTIDSRYRGVAPQSTMVVVSLNNNNSWYSNVLDGINYIYKIADSLHLPCTINLSVGTYDGSHDGKDPTTRLIESIISNKKGRVLIAASGNSGHLNQHIRFNPNMDTTFTDFSYTSAFGGTYFNFWADTPNVSNLVFGLQADTISTLLPISQSYFFNFKSKLLDSTIKYGEYQDSLVLKNTSNTEMGTAYFYCMTQESAINFQCYIVPKSTSSLWRFSTTGIATLDMWVNSSLVQSSDIISTLPNSTINPQIINYKLSDKDYSIVSGLQCSDEVITVGNYVNKYGITDIDTIYRPIGGVVGEIASSSSKGPTRDQRLKPDISASGGQTISCVDMTTRASFMASPSNRKKLSTNGMYVVAGGTSMSSPVVAGATALLFEKYPHLTNREIKYLILKTAKKDSFTTPYSNNTYGNGKINIFQLLKYPVTYSCKDTGSINYNPNADFEDTSLCIKKIYGCTDTGSINYNPLANVNNGTCIRKIYGVMDTGCINYNSLANINTNSCIPKIYGCTDTGSINYNSMANVNNGTCIPKVYGVTDTGCINFNPIANVNNNSCIKKIYGCMNIHALNYNPKANIDDSSCVFNTDAIAKLSESKYTILPNPSNDYFNISCEKGGKMTLQLYQMIGTKIKEYEFTKSTLLDMRTYSRGIYILKLIENDKIATFKLILN